MFLLPVDTFVGVIRH